MSLRFLRNSLSLVQSSENKLFAIRGRPWKKRELYHPIHGSTKKEVAQIDFSALNLRFPIKSIPESVTSLPQYTQGMLKKVAHLIIERIEKWGDVEKLFAEGDFVYFFTQPEYAKETLYWKDEQDSEKTKDRLSQVLKLIEVGSDESFKDAETVKMLIWDYANEEGRGQVLWPTRVALSGREKSPDPFTLLSILGKQESMSRIRKAIEIL